jgi:Pyridoxamine 5'-phosphate oxidase
VSPHELLHFLRQHRLAVQSSVSQLSAPQAAVVGIAVTDRFEVVFDTLDSTRKAKNLRVNEHIAIVIGGLTPGDERTAQYEGIADVPTGEELHRLTALYYTVYPDGPSRASLAGLIYVRVRPTWIRYSDYNVDPPLIVEFRADQLVV